MVSKEKEQSGPHFRSALSHSDLSKLDFFGYFMTRGICCYSTIENVVDAVES